MLRTVTIYEVVDGWRFVNLSRYTDVEISLFCRGHRSLRDCTWESGTIMELRNLADWEICGKFVERLI